MMGLLKTNTKCAIFYSTGGGELLQVYDISPDGSMVTVLEPFNWKVYVVKTDGSGILTSFPAALTPFFCGDNEWVYYRIEASAVLHRTNVNTGVTERHAANSQGHPLYHARCYIPPTN